MFKRRSWTSRPIRYVSKEDSSTVYVPAVIDPYDILGVDKEDMVLLKSSFRRLIVSENRSRRANVSLAYAMLSGVVYGSLPSYFRRKSGRNFEYDSMNLVVMVLTGQCESLKDLVDDDDDDDDVLETCEPAGYSLLYIASRSGFIDVVSYLIEAGVDVNNNESPGGKRTSALHAAAYYGHYPVVMSLVARGGSLTLKNCFGSTPEDEAKTDEIKKLLRDSELSIFGDLGFFIQKIYSQPFMSKIERIMYGGELIAYRIVRNITNRGDYVKNRKRCWHGTKKDHVLSILKNGLRKPGDIIDGQPVVIPDGHISLNTRVNGVDNWSCAIFCSPEVAYASHPVYSERVAVPGKGEYCILLEVAVKPDSYTKHASTLAVAYTKASGEKMPEVRVKPGSVESSYNASNDATIIHINNTVNVVVLAFTLLSVRFIENTKLGHVAMGNLIAGEDKINHSL